MEDKDKSQAQLINELQLIRWRVEKFEQDELRYKQFLEEYEETVTEHFDIYYHAHDMVVSVDMQTEKVLQCNKGVIETLGYGRAEIVGHPVFQLYHQDYVEDAKELFRVITETGEIRDAEQTLWKRDGGKISVSLNATSIRDENEKPTSMLFDWRDITRRAVEIGDLRSENRQLKEHLRSNRPEHPEVFSDIVTQDPAMYSIFHQVESIAVTGQPVLITGVGKEKIAEAIHQLNGRLGEFVPVNIAGLDDLMFSDTFFGHRRGAFTGADSARHGLIEQASGGTLFLDEIGDLGMESQTKLLRFLQDGEYRHLGEDAPIGSDVRIVSTTNQTIESLTGGENFRSDLYYRLETHHIHLPSLRERRGDIRLLVNHFLKQAAEALGKKIPVPSPELFTLLATYHFPGNIRELEGMVRDAVGRHKGGVLSTESFREAIDEQTSVLHKNTVTVAGEVGFAEALASARSLPSLKEVEPLVIEEALNRADGNQTIAAQLLGISRQALHNRLSRVRKLTDET